MVLNNLPPQPLAKAYSSSGWYLIKFRVVAQAWSVTESGLVRGLASYCMTRFQRNQGVRLESLSQIKSINIPNISGQELSGWKP